MLYKDLKDRLEVGKKYDIEFRKMSTGEIDIFENVVVVNIHYKKSYVRVSLFNGMKRTIKLISIIRLNGEKIYL